MGESDADLMVFGGSDVTRVEILVYDVTEDPMRAYPREERVRMLQGQNFVDKTISQLKPGEGLSFNFS